MRSSRRIRTRFPRPLSGLAALILYGACALLLPALHLSSHDRPHDHLPHGLRLHPLGAAHLFADAAHDESVPDHAHGPGPLASPPSNAPTWAPPQPPAPLAAGHGQGSVAHFAAGYLAVSPCVAPAALPWLLTLPPPSSPVAFPLPAPVPTHAPRAPPVLCS